MISKSLKISNTLISIFFSLLFLCTPIFAQNNENDEFEVFLSFRHRGVIDNLVVSYYKSDEFFLPLNELFNVFEIEINSNGLQTNGNFSANQIPYSIDLEKQIIQFGNETFTLTKEDFLVKELDSYLRISRFSEVFDLNFDVDFNSLSLSLQTDVELPAVARTLRNRTRRITDRSIDEAFHPLLQNSSKNFIDLGFLDYSLSSNIRTDQTSYNYNSSIGMKIAGGDLQGSFFGTYTNQFSTFSTNRFRWQFINRNSKLLSRVIIGQTSMDGVLPNSYTGIRITNEPIEARQVFDEFEIEGSTFPESEIELYVNNSLVDFSTADDIGNYRFLTPISYGSSQLSLKIFGPTGQVLEQRKRIQVPFTFIPEGELNYVINAGRLDNPIIGSTVRNNVIQANTGYGITNWLTTKVGVEYYENLNTTNSTIFTSLVSARFLYNYILNLQAVSNSFYRASINAVYPNAASVNLGYTDYISKASLLNTAGNDKQINASLFYPLKFLKIPLNFRVSSFSRYRDNNVSTTFRTDLSVRLQKFNFRFGYSDRLFDSYNPFNSTDASAIISSATYNVSRNPTIPSILRGAFFRTQMRYFPSRNSIDSFEFLYSRSLLGNGRLQLVAGRNFTTGLNNIRFNLIFDFKKVRTNSTFIRNNNSFSSTQNIRGSIGYDSNYRNFILTSRDQVGRSGTAIKLFVDNNNNNAFDEGDDSIDDGGFRIGRSGSSSIKKNGIIYYTQMQPYFRYNMDMNKGSIQNPMLVPNLDKFSIVTEPNSFKQIEIPFYMSGVIDGNIQRIFSTGKQEGIGGLKVTLKSTDNDFIKELRTFSDGSFYEYEVPPGDYELFVDQNQLDLLGVKSNPVKLNFTVNAIPEGDFVEGLSLILLPTEETEESELDSLIIQPLTLSEVGIEIRNSPEILVLEQKLNEDVSRALRMLILAQNAFYAQDIEGALDNINRSLEFFKTAQGYALKGSILYFKGDRVEAVNSWRMALRYDPDIYIPTLEELDQRVTISSSD